jgi:hypothetical protein
MSKGSKPRVSVSIKGKGGRRKCMDNEDSRQKSLMEMWTMTLDDSRDNDFFVCEDDNSYTSSKFVAIETGHRIRKYDDDSIISFNIGHPGEKLQGLVNVDSTRDNDLIVVSTNCGDTKNKNCACCKPITIPGLVDLLQKDEQTSSTSKISKPSYASVLAAGIKPYDPFRLLNVKPVQFTDVTISGMKIVENDQNSKIQLQIGLQSLPFGRVRLNSAGLPDYFLTEEEKEWGRWIRFHSGGCDTCSYGDHLSYQLDDKCQDEEILFLDHVEVLMSSSTGLKYPPFRKHLQEMAWEIRGMKDELYTLEESKDRKRFVQLCDDVEEQTSEISFLLRIFTDRENDAKCSMVSVALAVYKNHLKSLALETNQGGPLVDCGAETWKQLKASTPSAHIPTIEIVMKGVIPFLLGDGEYVVVSC